MNYKGLILNIENDPALHKMFKAVVELIPQIPALDKLIQQATQHGPITVDFVNKSQAKTDGAWEQRGEIRGKNKKVESFIKVVKEGQSFTRMFETFIFELCNAKNPNFQLFGQKSIQPSNFSSREDYALATEFAEYTETHVPSREILHAIFSNPRTVQALRTKGLPISEHELWQLKSDGFRSFHDWWHHANVSVPGRPYSHADIYRQDFDRKRPQTRPQPVAPKTPSVEPKTANPPYVYITLGWDAKRQGNANGEWIGHRHGHGHRHKHGHGHEHGIGHCHPQRIRCGHG